jgi:hypothetical protein
MINLATHKIGIITTIVDHLKLAGNIVNSPSHLGNQAEDVVIGPLVFGMGANKS